MRECSKGSKEGTDIYFRSSLHPHDRLPNISETFGSVTVFGSLGRDSGAWRYGCSLFFGDDGDHHDSDGEAYV